MNRSKAILFVLSCALSGILAFAQSAAEPTVSAKTEAAQATTNRTEAPALSSGSAVDAASSQPVPVAPAAAAAAVAVPQEPAPSKTVSAEAGPSGRNIRFQFDAIPYVDVLERFAQMANKPLVADTNLQGTVTFNDPNPYSYPEALDTLNLILSMKDMTLMESDHYLRLVPLKQLPQMPLRILRGLDKTGDVRPGEIVTVLLELKNLEAKDAAEAVSSMLSNAGSVAPLTRGRGLILTDRLANIQRVRSLITMIDTQTVAERQMKSFTLLHASGAVVADLINRTFGVSTAPKRTQYNPQSKQLDTLPPDPNDYVTAVYDDASRTLVLFGPRERFTLAEELISKFEDKDGGTAGDVRIYFPQVMKADELAQMIRQAIPGVAAPNESGAAAATKARLIVDASQNRLVVAAPLAGQLDEIETLINKVDNPVHGSGGVPLRSQAIQITRVFRPRTSDVSSLAKILSDALARRTPGGMKVPTANVTVETNTQSVVVTGSPGEVQLATDVITQLENGSNIPTPQETRLIDVGTIADAKRLLPLVEQIYRSQVSDNLGGQAAHAKLLVDDQTGRLIVTASQEHLRKIEDIVRQLKAERNPFQDRRLQILSLSHLRVDAGITSISNLVSERMSEKRFADLPRPLLLADAANNRLLITSTDDQFKEIEQLVRTLDIGPEKGQREMRMIPVQSKSATELITLASQLMTQMGDTEINPQLAPKLVPDSSGKQIIVLAAPQDLERITALIQRLDNASATATARQFKGVGLFSRNATELAPLVQQLYQEQLKGQSDPAGGPATLLAETKDNRIMVSGSEKEIARVEAIIRQLDPQGRKGSKEETRVVRLKTAVAGDLASLVEKSLSPQAQQVKVLVDARSNSLVLTGDAGAVEAASQIIQQLDTQSDVQPRELRLIELKSAEASTVAPMVTSLFTDIIKDQRGAEYKPQTKIVPDPSGNRLIITGSKDELRTVAGLVEQLDQMPEAAGLARVFKLTVADASSLVTVVSNAMVRFDARNRPIRVVSVSADEKSNSLVVSGSRADLQDAQAIIERLDGEGGEKGRVLKVLDVTTDDPDALAGLAMKVFTAQNSGRNLAAVVSITPEPSGKRLIVLAPSSMLAQVETVITTLDAKPDQGTRELQTVELKTASAQKLLPTVRRIYAEQTQGKTLKPATIYPDASGTRLLVYGTRDQGASVRQIVETMISSNAPARETRSFEVGRPEDVQRLLPLVQQLYQDQWKEKGDSDPADAQILSDARTGRLIVTGKPEHLKQIEIILHQLNSAKPRADAHDTRIFDLTTANASELANTVRTLYEEGAKSRLGNLPSEVLILPDASANRLIVTGEHDEVQAVEEIIQKLDKVSAQSGTVRVFKLKYADPAKVLEILGNALTSYDSYGRSRRRVGVTSDAKTRTIIVAGDPKELQSLQNAAIIIEQLDNALGQQAERKIKVITLANVKVSEISPKLRQLYNDQLASKPDLAATDVLILEDAPSNQLIFAGSDAQLGLLGEILNQLQAAQVQQGHRETKLIEIGQTDEMQRLLPLVRQLYRERWRDRSAADPADAQIIPDARNARLIITARTNHIAEIEGIVAQLRGGTANVADRETRIYDLTTATAMELSATVRSLYDEQSKSRPGIRAEDTSILPDASANRLIVTATTNELNRVEDIIKKLDKVSAQSASVRVFKLKSAEPDKVAEILSTALVSYDAYGRPRKRVSISVDPKSRTIIAAGDPKELQGVSVVVEQLDSTLGGQTERRMKVLPIKVGKVAELLTKVRAVYEDQIKAQPELGTSDPLLLEDRTSNQLIVAGTDKQLSVIEEITNQLENSSVALEPRETRVYELTSTSAPELAATVKSLYQEASKAHPTLPSSQALLLPDVNANRLIVSATTNDLKLIDDIIQKLDKTEAQAGRTRVFKLRSAEAQQVATILSTALVQINTSGRSTPRVSVGTDAQNNLLIVSGAPQDLQSAAVIVEQMDQMLAREPRQMRVVALKTGLASEVAMRVKQLYQDQLKGQAKTGPADAIIMGDNVSGRLILTASESHMKVIEEIVDKLQETGEGTGRQLRVVGLQRNSAASIATMIAQLFGRQVNSEDPSQHLAVSPSEDDRTLVLDAAAPLLEKVEQLVKSLDGEEALGKVEIRTYQMPEGNASDLAPTLARLFSEKGGQAAPSGLAPRFEADAAANVLLVAATREQFTQIDKLVQELKTTAHVANEIRTFKLQNADPTQISEVLQAMLTEADPSQPGVARPRRTQWRPGVGQTPVADVKMVRVAPARSLNAVVVQGPPEKLALAEKLIQSLDRDEAEGRTVIQSVRLKKAHAENLAEAVNKTMATRGGTQSRLQRVSVTPVVGPNSLLLNGPADAVQEVLQVIRDLDQESEDEEIKVHIYKLENGNAREISAVIQQLLLNVTRGQMRLRAANPNGAAARVIQPSVSVEERSNSLVISGTAAHFKVVEQLLSTLDKVPERAERDVQFVWLRNAKADDVASKLDAVFAGRAEGDKPVIDADIFNNSITIIGKRAEIVQLQDLINRLDESSRDTSMQVRLRPLVRVPVDQMARMLQNIYPQMSAGSIRVVEKIQPQAKPEKNGGVPSAEHKEPAPPGATAEAAPLQEKKGEGEHGSPEVVVAIDRSANALILSGPTHELDQVDHIISELSFSYISSDAEFRVFPLKDADPVVVARTLTELFRPEPVQVQPQPAQQPAGQRPGEVRVVAQTPKVTAVAEPRTRSVIVRAKPTDFTLMESLINQLDVAGISSKLEFRIIALTNAPPQKVAPLVQQMVTQLNGMRPGEPLTVMPDARSRGLLVIARDTVLRQVEGIIHSLDTPSPYEEAQVLVVSLKRANAAQLATVLQAMLRPGAQGEMTSDAHELQEQIRRLRVKNEDGKEVLLDLTKPIRIQGDSMGGSQNGGNRLILSSTPDNLKALAAVVEMMDAVPVSEGVGVKLIHLEFADAATVSQTLTTVFNEGQRLAIGPSGRAEPEGTAGKALVNPLNVAIDTRSNSLILSGRKESLELAQKVISDLDRKIERFFTEVKLFRLKHASARRLAPLLQSVFAEGPSVPGTEGLATQVTRLRAVLPEDKPPTTEQPKTRSALVVQADDTTNVMIVAARTDTMPIIEAVINQLDIPSASGMEGIRVYALDHADPVVVQKILNDLHSGPRAAQLRTEDIPNITVDERTQALIVSGNAKAFAFIEGLIAQLDRELPLELRDVRIIPLENADAGAVASSLQRLLDARLTQKAALGRQQADSLRVLVLGEPRSNSLLVAGSKDSFELVESLARELDAAPPALSGRIRLVPLSFADARILSAALINLFNERYQAARSPETQRNRPVIVPDPRSNSLLIAAGVDDNQTIDDLIAKLDRHVEDPSMVLTVMGLRHNNSTTVATTLETIFTARLRSRTIPGQPPSPHDLIKIEPDSLNNSLIISASRENLDLITSLLQKIDVEPVVPEGVVQTFTLEFADATRIASMLRSLVQQGLYRPGMGGPNGQTPRESMAITVDSRSNTLIVSASPENLMVIKEVIRQLDSKELAQSGNIRFYQLKHARASSLASVLEQFFRARRAGEAGAASGDRSIPVTVVPDDRSNALLVTGGKESFDVIDRMIEQLDGDDVQARMGFRVFILKQSTAAKLQSTLQRLFANRPSRIKGEQPEPITVVADSWVNALIVGASIDDMSTVASLVERLDSEQAQMGVTVQVFPMAKADARRVAQIVQGLYREGGPGGTMPVAVTADERMNSIVVSGGEGDLKRIGELIKKLDTDQVGRVAEIRIFPLEHARADALSTILNTALNTKPAAITEQNPNTASLLQFITRAKDGKELVASALKEGVLITPDLRMNSLIVSAPVDYMNLIEQIIVKLDYTIPQQAKIKVFTLVNADARLMAELLMSLFRLQPSGQPIGSQRAVQYTLVKERQPASPDSKDAGESEETEGASATLGTDEQSALHVTVDHRTNSLLVGGTEHYVELVTEIIQTLDSSEAQERKSDIYRLKNAQASDIQSAIRNFLDQDRQRMTQILGQDAVGTAQRMLEREVGIVAETNSNTLLVSASPRYFPELTNLIVRLDQPRPQVLIQVLLAEVTLDSTQDLGVEWNITKTVESAKLATGTDLGVLQQLKSFGGFSAAVTGGDYNFLIRALQNDGRLEVLSRPQILTADNKAATINVGQRIPLVTGNQVTPLGGTVNTIEYQNVGVNLQVTPRIGADGAVRMEISTTNSDLSTSSINIPSSSAGGTISLPIINERRATTSVSVQSGQSIIIGGLIQTSEDNRIKKVPYLGDIPGLGVLFRSKTRTTARKELLILLTPQVLIGGNDIGKVGDLKDVTRQQLERSSLKDEIRRDDFRDRLLEPLYPNGLKPLHKPKDKDSNSTLP